MGVFKGTDSKTVFAIGGYMFCSATMLIANKIAVHFVPAPSFILLMQLIGTVIVVQGARVVGFLDNVDTLTFAKVKAFAPVALIFTATIYTNIASLQYANVETFMVFRFSTPLAISVADYLFLGRQLPEARSWLSLFMLLAGGVGYTLTDSAFQIEGYMFCAVWYALFCLDQIYLKHVVDTVRMDSMWGRVYYSNLLSCVPLMCTGVAGSELSSLMDHMTTIGAVAIGVTVLIGVAMSYFAWSARSLLAATSFTVVGNVCKILTVVLNVLAWDKHASPLAMCFLALSFSGAYFYKQAPLRSTTPPPSPVKSGSAIGNKLEMMEAVDEENTLVGSDGEGSAL
eukprot:CAMPEP_0117620426 /NCGR_PEP_ID=MMETSP0784-20121206/87121_1 /TAXON_ID=39447 /ORGANISM="" /LENGTH=340 /DNA_ID=CAMNT_0005424337 /DNA_START=49 /DNA_END=1071 /DNA_ORIENTATION=+